MTSRPRRSRALAVPVGSRDSRPPRTPDPPSPASPVFFPVNFGILSPTPVNLKNRADLEVVPKCLSPQFFT